MTKRTFTTTLVALALAGLLGACSKASGSDDGGPASLGPDATTTRSNNSRGGREASAAEMQDAILDYAKCMRDHGVNIPDPEIGEDGSVGDMPDLRETGASQDTISAAEAACQPILDAVNPGGDQPDPQEIAQTLDQMIAVTGCMRTKGYDMADPRVGDNGEIIASGGLPRDASQEQLDQQQADIKACQDAAGIDAHATENEK
jgi:hypothetical protein